MPKKKTPPKSKIKAFKKKKVSDKAGFSVKKVGGKANRKKDNLEAIRHTAAHVMAYAVKKLFPDARFGIGPVIDTGFYYDFSLPRSLRPDDLPKIEKKMKEIIKQNLPVEKLVVPIARARQAARVANQKYKLELISDIESGKKHQDDTETKDGEITFYRVGEFTDLCRGNHAQSTGEIPIDSFKLTHVAGAYWKGDEKNDQMQRIYGALFTTNQDLHEYLEQIEEAKKRDHRKLGKTLDLFTFSSQVGAGLPLWTPKGTMLRNLLDEFVWELRQKIGFQKVEIPHITKKDLYITSGHWAKFSEELFKIQTREKHEFAMKPMNCPHHTQIYARKTHSYRELPQRYANTTMVYRDEQTGELNGLSRVRCITQDDAHVFCRFNQAQEEIEKLWDIIEEFYKKTGGFELRVRLSLHDENQMEKYLGDHKKWLEAEEALRKVVKAKKIEAEEAPGEAAFYGPKIDFMATDSMRREWQLATIQFDMNMPENFNLTCANEKGEAERIVMLHCAVMGSIERYLAILIEHLAGAFPIWLIPTQVTVVPISDKFNSYAYKITKQLFDLGIRVEVDDRNQSIGKKIRESEMQKVPYMLVVGEKEQQAKKISVRKRGEKEQKVMALETLIKNLQKEIADKK